MNSKARVAGRAVHPMFVGFPMALFVATVGLELAYTGSHDLFYVRAAMVANIAGVLAALVAIIPGAIDYLASPQQSRAKRLATAHALLDIVTVGLFTVSAVVLFRDYTGREMVEGADVLDATIPLALGVIGIVSLVSAAMLGYALVRTHHVGSKPASVRTEIPSRDPELEAVLASLDSTPAVATLVARGTPARPRPAYRPQQHITVH